MTTAKTSKTFRLPDRPERGPDDMTSYRQLSATSIIGPLSHYLGRRETTLITGDQYLCRVVTPGLAGARYPDLLIAFNADLDSHRRRNGYVIADQGKPPDFVLEIASAKTGRSDAGRKRRDYAGFGIPEYWRFDETPAGRWHGARLAGDRLARGRYEPIPIEQLPGDVLQGYSQVLNINLRWENGELLWYDPVTGRHIPTFHEERERADQEYGARLMAQQRAEQERQARLTAQQSAEQERDARLAIQAQANQEREAHLAAQERADSERQARLAAEARARELEAELEQLRRRQQC